MRAGTAFMTTLLSKHEQRSILNSGYSVKTVQGTAVCCTTEKTCTSQTGVIRNVHTRMQKATVRMMLWATTHKVMVCFTMTMTMAVLEQLPR